MAGKLLAEIMKAIIEPIFHFDFDETTLRVRDYIGLKMTSRSSRDQGQLFALMS
jgi:hypothetical protein